MRALGTYKWISWLAAAVLALSAWGCGDSSGDGSTTSSAASSEVAAAAATGISVQTERQPLDPTSIPQYVTPLVIPPAMPPEGQTGKDSPFTLYKIGVRQFSQQVLPEGWPATTVWGYGLATDPKNGPQANRTFHWPAYTIEAQKDQTIRVLWENQLTDQNRNYLPHLLPVDPTLHWANPPGGIEGRDQRPAFTTTPGPYTGPVPIVTHLHGAHVPDISDGYPEAWYLPNAKDIPPGYAIQGTRYRSVQPAPPGAAWFEYPNDQRPATLWYHDHTLGMTRLNVYAGMSGFWLIRSADEETANLPGPAPAPGDPPGKHYYEIPLAIQDRSFNTDGSLFYPDTRAFFDGYPGPYIPATPVAPIWNPEFFGNTIVVNGNTWPYLEVEPRLYRLRILNGCNARFLILKFNTELPFHQIGNEGGLLPGSPLQLPRLLLAPAERADVLVDFSGFSPGDKIQLLNLGPDEPFGGGEPEEAFEPADPATTGQVMQFRVVVGGKEGNAGAIPTSLPAIEPLGAERTTRDLTLNEIAFPVPGNDEIPIEAELGTAAAGPLPWMAPITENPMVGDTEVWRLINLTADAHPIHLHLVTFEVLERRPFDVDAFIDDQMQYLLNGRTGDPPQPQFTGPAESPQPWEAGRKDTVIAYPGEVTFIKANFDLAGLYVWHCHILEHEDNEMMRPFYVGPLPAQ